MVKTSVKFQKNWSKTVGGVAYTRYILYRGTEGPTDRRTDGRNDGKPKTMSLRFSSKRRGTISIQLQVSMTFFFLLFFFTVIFVFWNGGWLVAEPHSTTFRCGPWWIYLIKTISDWMKQDFTWLIRGQCHVCMESFFLIGLASRKKVRANELGECVNLTEIMDFKQEIRDFSYGTSPGEKI